jgi:hypothetical protein
MLNTPHCEHYIICTAFSCIMFDIILLLFLCWLDVSLWEREKSTYGKVCSSDKEVPVCLCNVCFIWLKICACNHVLRHLTEAYCAAPVTTCKCLTILCLEIWCLWEGCENKGWNPLCSGGVYVCFHSETWYNDQILRTSWYTNKDNNVVSYMSFLTSTMF